MNARCKITYRIYCIFYLYCIIGFKFTKQYMRDGPQSDMELLYISKQWLSLGTRNL